MSSEEGNKLIAEFYGDGYMFRGVFVPIGHLEYHSSWDWLMPVVEKIEGKEIDLNVSVVIKNDKCRIYRHKNSDYEMTISDLFEGTTKIEATWNATIQFIQWYNKTQNQ